MYRLCLLALGFATASAVAAETPAPPKTASNRVIAVTVYPNSALVTREVSVPEGTGPFELVVTPLPPQTVNSSLYSEGTDGIRVLTTRFRQRPIKEDTREEVRKLEAQQKELQNTAQKLQSEMRVLELNLQTLTKLEGFTATTMQHLTDKGQLNSDSTIALAKYVMDSRTQQADGIVANKVQQQTNLEQIQYVQRKLQEMAAGSNKTERDAVIVVDKTNAAAGRVRLNYLVDSTSWRPQYKFHAEPGNGKDKGGIQVEYQAAVIQQTGEDWSGVDLTLSTAQPMLSAAPPELKMLEVAIMPRRPLVATAKPGAQQSGIMANGALALPNPNADEFLKKAQSLRGTAQMQYKSNDAKKGSETLNSAAALEQARDLVALREEDVQDNRGRGVNSGEGPSVTYHLPTRLTIPSRNDEQVIEVTKLDMAPEYFYKAVPILTPHVYRLANLTNTSKYVLLPGEATMYIGTDFVGRSNLPLVAIGEQFTAGFGVDPQLQVQRQLIDKTRTTNGDNQVLKFEYRILVSSYKAEPVKLQLWDRLPHTETEAVGVNLGKMAPEISKDPLYLRESRPHNLLRWDLDVEPATTGEKALAVQYEFRLEMGRQMEISNFAAK